MKFTDFHEWVTLEKDIATIGITSFSKNELGEVVYIEFPEVRKKIKAGDILCVLESTKTAFDICSPMTGEVVAVNSELKEDLQKLNKDPQGEGWLVKIRYSQLKEYEKLMNITEYRAKLAIT